VAWPWCNLAVSQRRPDCTSVNNHSPVGLVSRQWSRWPSLCTVWPSHSKWPSEQISEPVSMALHILQLSCGLFFLDKTLHHPGLSSPQQPRCGSLRLLDFSKAKIAVESEEICECDGHSVHQLRQRRLNADWLDPRESDCLRKCSKVSSDWLPSYIKATRPVLEIFKTDDYFPDSPRTVLEKLQRL